MSNQARPPAESALDVARLGLPDDSTSPSRSRALVRSSLASWGLDPLVFDAELVVTELVTNALRHGLPPALLTIWRFPTTLRIEVRDQRPSMAFHELPLRSLDGDESGRGRGIVEQVSDHCGVDGSSGSSKTAYASWDVGPAA